MLIDLIAYITRHPRQRVELGVDFAWSSRSFVHNIFRVWELLAGRRSGIRAETSLVVTGGNSYYYFHTWESVFAHIEATVRGFFKLRPARIWIPISVTPQGVIMPASPYLLAIAWDNSLASGSASFSFTVTGSNTIMTSWVHDISGGNNVSAVSYGGSSLTQQNATQSSASNWDTSWLLVGPSTGSNTWAKTGGATNECVNSYTGAKQSSQPDTKKSTTGTSTSPSASITTGQTDCTVSGCVFYDNNSALSSPSGLSNPANNSGNSASCYSGNSSNQSTPGSVTQSATIGSSTTWCVLQISMLATTSAPPNTSKGNFLAFM